MTELFGRLIGVLVLVVGAWLLALALVGYAIGDLNPFNWSSAMRTVHLIVQLALIGAYESWRRWA